MLRNQGVQTNSEVLANRPDIIVKNKKEKTCVLIDVAIPSDRNVIQKKAEEKLKYKYLSVVIQRMWNMKCFVRFQVLTAASMMFRVVFWDILLCKIIVDRRFRGAYCLHPTLTAAEIELLLKNSILKKEFLHGTMYRSH
jgi:hypothetical protein